MLVSCDITNNQVRLASFGLVLQVLDSVKDSYANSFVILPDGSRLDYSVAVACVEDSVSKLFSNG